MHLDPKYLYSPCREVLDYSPIPEIGSNMLHLLYHGDKQVGTGLASNQVGLNLRIIVIDYASFRGILVNPVVLRLRGGYSLESEGCLSFPNKFIKVSRHKIISLRFFDEHGQSSRIKARGHLARILQHELDHLNGITIMSNP